MTGHDTDNAQLGFDAMLGAAEADNQRYRFEQETGHLPGTMDEAIPFFRILLGHHHAAMLAGDADEVFRLRKEAERLALRLNDGDPGILAGPDAPGKVLERQTAAKAGTVPLWGQPGTFDLCVDGMKARIELEGVFFNRRLSHFLARVRGACGGRRPSFSKRDRLSQLSWPARQSGGRLQTG